MKTESERIADLERRIDDLRIALVHILRNDKTEYEYQEKRRGDEKKPPAGARWQTPRELAEAAWLADTKAWKQ